MPNHVSHRVFVRGNGAAVKQFKNKHFRLIHEDGAQVPHFEFNSIIAMPAGMEKIIDGSDTDEALHLLQCLEKGDKTARIRLDAMKQKYSNIEEQGRLRLKYLKETGHSSWYDWRVEHWGTKWPAYETKIVGESEGYLEFTFETAWDTPLPIFHQLAREWPELTLEIYAFDEGWCFGCGGWYNANGKESYDYIDRTELTDELYQKVYGFPPQRGVVNHELMDREEIRR